MAGLAGPVLFKKALDSLTDVKFLNKGAIYAAVGALVASAASKVSCGAKFTFESKISPFFYKITYCI